MSKLVLEFRARSGSPVMDLVIPQEQPAAAVVGLMTDVPTWWDAREFLERVRRIHAGELEAAAGYGDAYYTEIGRVETRIAFNEQPAVTVATTTVLDVAEQWLSYLAREYPGSGVPVG